MIYQIKNWSESFEGAKSKTYNNKTSCQMPTKHSLGYKRVVKRENGAAVFGAWCALIQVLSRHNKERQGYCTDTGRIDGKPYTSDDLELLTDIPAIYFDEMFAICSAQNVDWIRVITAKDTTGIPQETIVPLDSDLDSDLNSDSDSDVDSYPELLLALQNEQSFENAIACIYACNDSFSGVSRFHIENALKSQPDRDRWAEAISGMASKFAGVKMDLPCNNLRNWLNGKSSTSQSGKRNVSEL